MATYTFETITAAQALTFDSTGDTLLFTNATSSGSKMTVLYNVATATQPATITLIDNAYGKSVTFGTGVAGLGEAGHTSPVFLDTSTLIVDSDTSGGSGTGGAGNDGLFGGGG